MIDQSTSAARFYDAVRACNAQMLDGVDAAYRSQLLEQMVGALASVVVERAPADAERLWFGAARDVRLHPPAVRRRAFRRRIMAAVRRAAGLPVWVAGIAICVVFWGLLIGSLLR